MANKLIQLKNASNSLLFPKGLFTTIFRGTDG